MAIFSYLECASFLGKTFSKGAVVVVLLLLLNFIHSSPAWHSGTVYECCAWEYCEKYQHFRVREEQCTFTVSEQTKENSGAIAAVPKITPLFLKLNAEFIWYSQSAQSIQSLQ